MKQNPPVPNLPRAKPGTPSVSQRPVEWAQWCYLTTGLPERIGPRPCREKIPRFRRNGGFSIQIVRPNTQSVSQRPVGRFLLALRLAQPTSHEFASGGSPQKSPASCETGDFYQNCPNSIRRAEASDRSGSFARLMARKNHQARICPGPSPVRRAEASDRSGNFTRLSSSTTYQARVWPPALPGGTVNARSLHFDIKNVRIPYAERKLATGRAVSARLMARTTYQSRVWPPALPGGVAFVVGMW